MKITTDAETARDFIDATLQAMKARRNFHESMEREEGELLTDALYRLLDRAVDFCAVSIDDRNRSLDEITISQPALLALKDIIYKHQEKRWPDYAKGSPAERAAYDELLEVGYASKWLQGTPGNFTHHIKPTTSGIAYVENIRTESEA